MYLRNAWYAAALSEELGNGRWAGSFSANPWFSIEARQAGRRRWKIAVATERCRFRWAASSRTGYSAAITDLSSTPREPASRCRARPASRPRRGSGDILWSNATAGCGSGWAAKRAGLKARVGAFKLSRLPGAPPPVIAEARDGSFLGRANEEKALIQMPARPPETLGRSRPRRSCLSPHPGRDSSHRALGDMSRASDLLCPNCRGRADRGEGHRPDRYQRRRRSRRTPCAARSVPRSRRDASRVSSNASPARFSRQPTR